MGWTSRVMSIDSVYRVSFRRLMHFSARPLSLLLLCLLILPSTGCLRKFRLDLMAGPCLNPPDEYCAQDGSGSRVLEVQVYQLRTWVDPNALAWEDFLDEDQVFDQLKSYMTDPDNRTLVKTRFTIEANESRIQKMYRLRGTKYLLIATAGRNKGKQSLLVLPIAWTQREEKLWFEYYDVKSRSKLREAISPNPNQPIEVPGK